MSSAVPAPPGAPDPVPGASPPAPPPGKPRKRFILIGTAIGLVLVAIVALLTRPSSSHGGAPTKGDPVPSFSATNIGPTGAAQVAVPSDGGGNGTPAVLLFFGSWCPACHDELPALASTVRAQDKARGALSHIAVIGVDSLDTTAAAKSFVRGTGVTFPVAFDPKADITNGAFYFYGDPYAVFVKGNGKIAEIVRSTLTPNAFTADERALIRST